MRPQPRMQNKKAYEHSHHGRAGYARHSPRNGFNGFLRALLGDRAFCHRRRQNEFRRLDASVEAPGPHDFAVRVRRCSSAAPSASIASRPASVTIASAPLVGRDGADYCGDLRREETEIFFETGLDSKSLLRENAALARHRTEAMARNDAWAATPARPAIPSIPHIAVLMRATPSARPARAECA
jgi:hypothetical protein